ncbi:Rieske (2Fe-2S) protein [Glutamicibacter endophyticus]|uniref:Rieske (2Fe-2S) protein n=1 Tax=Glutamicibacter endophyticus TaxID=1522174 RepID=UPI003AEFD586
MSETSLPNRRTVVGVGAALGGSALLAACGDGHSAAPVNSPSTVPEPTGQGQALLTLADLPVGSRASAVASGANGSEVGVLLFRPSEDSVLAYTNVCTHQGCAVSSDAPSGEDFYCACHGSQFSPADGTATHGPAKAALARFATKIEGDEILVFIPKDAI